MAMQIDSCYYGTSYKTSNRDLFESYPPRIGMTDYYTSRKTPNVKYTVSHHIIGHDDYDKVLFIGALKFNRQSNKAIKLIDFINKQGYYEHIKYKAKSKAIYFETFDKHNVLVEMVEPCEREYIIITIDKSCVGDI